MLEKMIVATSSPLGPTVAGYFEETVEDLVLCTDYYKLLEACHDASRASSRCMLLDANLREAKPFELMKTMVGEDVKVSPEYPVIMTSHPGSMSHAARAWISGATDFISLDAGPDKIGQVIGTALEGKSPHSSGEMSKMIKAFKEPPLSGLWDLFDTKQRRILLSWTCALEARDTTMMMIKLGIEICQHEVVREYDPILTTLGVYSEWEAAQLIIRAGPDPLALDS